MNKKKEVKISWEIDKINKELAGNEKHLKHLYAVLASDEFATYSFERCKALTAEIALTQDLIKLQRITLKKLESKSPDA